MNTLKPLFSSFTVFFYLLLETHGTFAAYPTSKLNGIVGFAQFGGVTGGWSGNVVMINTLAEFIKNVGDNTAKVLVINRNISPRSLTKVQLGSNKSIIGSFGNRMLYNIYLRASLTSKNIIFQNLIIQHSENIKGNDDIQVYINFGGQYWIDHCSFIGHKWSGNDGTMDKLLYVGEKVDNVTISNCYFGNHNYGLILGHPQADGNPEYDGFPRLTLCHNHFESLNSRAPGLMRYGFYHVYNNYINKYHMGFTIGIKAKILSQNNYFDQGVEKDILRDKGTGKFTDIGSFPSLAAVKSPKCDRTTVPYKYKLLTPAAAKVFVLAHAGAQSKALVFGG